MSRQITIDAVRAFNNNYKFKRNNTEVKVISICEGTSHTELRLHNNLIAYKDTSGTYINSCGWQSVTTKERLNGLYGVHIEQRDFMWYLNGEAWNGNLIKI